MFDQFKEKYIEEVNDLLNDMECALLLLENTPDNIESINKVFRVMHTIKGTSGMYDFKEAETLTHKVENIYGRIRDNHLTVPKELVTITLEGVDIIRQLLNQPEEDYTATLSSFTQKLLQFDGASNAQQTPAQTDDGGIATYYVFFKPEANIAQRGVNLTNIIEELDNIAGSIVLPHVSDDLEKYYMMYWDAVFASDKPLADIKDIFMFTPDEVTITKISKSDLFKNPDFVQEVQKRQTSGDEFDLNILKSFAPDSIGAPDKKTATPQPSEPSAENSAREEKIILRNIEAIENQKNSIKVEADKLDELMNLVSELVVTKSEILSLAGKYNQPELYNLYEKIDKLSNKFKDNALSIRLIPIESMMLRFERLVRDLSKELGKEIDFVTEGTDTQLDKTIIDNLAVPLMHIIRNSIDHGIESVERRRELKKSDRGIIKLTAFYSGTNVFIQVQDDGAGMNPEYLRKKAIEKGFLLPTQAVTTRQLYDLVFLPGFSTAQTITGISGRGVGMDVVKQNIIKLRGEIDMDSEVNLGTITTIKLPLTLSIIDSLLVSIGEHLLLIPLYLIDSCLQTPINQIDNERKLFVYNDEPLPVINLRLLFEIGDKQPENTTLILVKAKNIRVCLTADKVIGEHQAVLKSLGRYFAEQEYISGASILGDGRIALVLDTDKLIRLVEKSKLN
ncbi:MAG: chemotaxis protein CheA [Bacteroidales bacterium]|nr:chemotaxis protein CheA [Bacteroidales bacterium]